MNYTFERLDKLVTVLLNPTNIKKVPDSAEALKGYIQDSITEKENIRLNLMNQIFLTAQDRELELVVERHQVSLVRLLDLIHSYQYDLEHHSENLNTCYQVIQQQIEELLSYIETHFSRYFCKDHKVPETYLKITRAELNIARSTIKEKIEDPLLVRIVTDPLNNFFEGKIPEITYRNLFYIKAFIGELTNTENFSYSAVKGLLVYMNYNDALFLHHCFEFYAHELQNVESKSEKLRVLHYHKKEMSRMQVRPGFSFHPDLPSVKEQLLCWLDEEISYQSLPDDPAETPLHTKEEKETGVPKMNLSLSVEQLGLFMKVLVANRVILNNNQMDIVKFFASHFTTQRKEEISPVSLHGKYYKHEPRTIRAVKDLLLNLVNTVGKIT